MKLNSLLLAVVLLSLLFSPDDGEVYPSDLSDFHQTTLYYIPEDSTLHNHCCENLKLKNYSPYVFNYLLQSSDVFVVPWKNVDTISYSDQSHEA
jgi:hypothetical protein